MNAPADSNAADRGVTRRGAMSPSIAGTIGAWVVVMLAVVIVLRVLDSVPGYITDTPRGVRSVRTIEAAERSLQARLHLPAYFPDTLRWPPASVEIYPGPPRAASVGFLAARGRDLRLVVCQTVEPADSVPVKLFPPALILESVRASISDRPATLMRVQLDDGRIVHELTWRTRDRMMAMRFDGPVEQLMALARSVKADRL